MLNRTHPAAAGRLPDRVHFTKISVGWRLFQTPSAPSSHSKISGTCGGQGIAK